MATGEAVAVFTPEEVAPAVHVYDVAPLAVILAVCPAHIVGELTVSAKILETVTVDTAVPIQPNVEPVTVYVVFVAGVAVAVLTPVEVAPADQVYEAAPVAVSVAVAVGQTVGEFTNTIGNEFAVTVDTAVAIQPNVEPVTVYVVVAAGVTVAVVTPEEVGPADQV